MASFKRHKLILCTIIAIPLAAAFLIYSPLTNLNSTNANLLEASIKEIAPDKISRDNFGAVLKYKVTLKTIWFFSEPHLKLALISFPVIFLQLALILYLIRHRSKLAPLDTYVIYFVLTCACLLPTLVSFIAWDLGRWHALSTILSFIMTMMFLLNQRDIISLRPLFYWPAFLVLSFYLITSHPHYNKGNEVDGLTLHHIYYSPRHKW